MSNDAGKKCAIQSACKSWHWLIFLRTLYEMNTSIITCSYHTTLSAAKHAIHTYKINMKIEQYSLLH